ncbi:polysaccharide biosynthesis/export family protein [Selenomonas sp.]|uniref:polysaccharide biosynthesis/export family protein n=1 Tax=Selenomonas sp. TaxID=2053611 RepID=UPI0025DC3761|nr:polysaccharide biosynthesis/export family protein [Selenomonas sp.]
MMLCGCVIAAGLFMGGLFSSTALAEGLGTQAVEVRPTIKAEPQNKGAYIESDEVFKVAGLHSGQVDEYYRLAKYDVITLSILGFPNGLGYAAGQSSASGNGSVDEIKIGPDGYAAVPYVGNVKLVGLSLDEARDLIQMQLSRYVKIPSMSIAVKSYGPRRIYVMGEVGTPGIHNLDIDNLNVYAAIGSAGGFTKRARSTRVQVIRVQDGTMYYQQLNMKAYVRRHDMTQNVQVQDGDIVYVPKSNGIFWQEDILPFFQAWSYYKAVTD